MLQVIGQTWAGAWTPRKVLTPHLGLSLAWEGPLGDEGMKVEVISWFSRAPPLESRTGPEGPAASAQPSLSTSPGGCRQP